MTTNNSVNGLLIGSNMRSAFGEMLVANATPVIQIQFPYNINTDIVTTSLVGSGSVTQSNSLAVIGSGAASSSSAMMRSLQSIQYRPGHGVSSLFTGVFSSGVSGNTQIVGVGNTNDGFFFGYNGTSFGIMHRKTGSDTWIPQSSWNGDKMNGTGRSGMTINPQYGNVFKIQFQWLGFGAINFFVEDSNTGEFTQVHQIKYANSNTVPSVGNPTLYLMAQSSNTTNNTNITLSICSMGAFVEGYISPIDVRNAITSSKSSITTEVNVLTIRNNSTFASKTNLTLVVIDALSILNQSSQEGIFRFYLNPTVGGTPSFTNINANTSVVSYDTAGTTISGGKFVGAVYMAGNQSQFINLQSFLVNLYPGNTFVCSCQSLGTALNVATSLSWTERF